MKRLSSGRPSGFSTVEVLVVLLIIGTLVTIALPRFNGMLTKARRSEVFANLPTALVAERGYFAEHGSYTDDLSRVAWRPDGEPVFLIGFVTDTHPQPSGLNDASELYAAGYITIGAAKMIDAHGLPLTQADLPASATVDPHTLAIGAVGNIDGDATLEVWTIGADGQLTNLASDVSD